MASFWSLVENDQGNRFKYGPRKCQNPVDIGFSLYFNFFKSSLYCPLIYVFETKVANQVWEIFIVILKLSFIERCIINWTLC